MSIVMKSNATKNEIDEVIQKIKSVGLRADVSSGEYQTVIGIVGDEKKVDFDQVKSMNGVFDAIRIQVPYRLISRSYIPEDISVKVGSISIGKDNPPVYIAGPCSIESYEQLYRIGKAVKDAGAHILRGGAFKPRTSIHSFQGLGEEGLDHLESVGKDLGMPTVTEIRSEVDVELIAKHTDVLQIGARNMFNQDLIEAAAKTGKPIFFKRGFSAQIDEYLELRGKNCRPRQPERAALRKRNYAPRRIFQIPNQIYIRSQCHPGPAKGNSFPGHSKSQPRHGQTRSSPPDEQGGYRIRRTRVDDQSTRSTSGSTE